MTKKDDLARSDHPSESSDPALRADVSGRQQRLREAARNIAAVSSPDCRCVFRKGALVAMCSLCEIGAERIEEALTKAVEAESSALQQQLASALQELASVPTLDAREQALEKNTEAERARVAKYGTKARECEAEARRLLALKELP